MIVRLKNIYLSVSWYFLIMFIWVIISNKVSSFLFCLAALMIHELGHIITIYVLKEKISVFYILPFGFCCRIRNQNKVTDKNMVKILLAGPATSICVAGLLFFWTTEFAFVNLIVGFFNLLPISSLDGGRLFKFANKF